MERIAFTLHLLPGHVDEYRRRHDDLWPELADLLRDAGISDYSIFLDAETDTLFATLQRTADHRMDTLPLEPVMRRWWAHMADLMVTHPDDEPVSRPLERLFHLA